MIRDTGRFAIPENAVFDSADYMLDRPGVIYKRGGSSYFGPAWGVAGATYAAAVAYFESPAGAQRVGITDNGHVIQVDSGSVIDKGILAGGAAGIDKPITRVDKLIIIDATHANDRVPKVYNGTTVAALGGSPPTCRFGALYKTRLAVGGNQANRNRTFFSPTPDIADTWDTADSYTDHDLAITGYAPLQNALIVFGEGRMEALVGSSPPPGGDFERRTIANVGCTDARSIAFFEGGAIFANPRGVFMTLGGTPKSLVSEGGIETYWQSLFSGYDRTTWVISGGVHRQFYVVQVLDNTAALVAGLVCHVPTRAWWRFARNRGLMVATAVGVQDEFYVADRAAQRLIALSGFWSPTAANKNDADGTAVTPFLETRLFGRGTGLKHFGRGRLTYDMRDAAVDNPTLAISTAPGVEAPVFTAVPESPLSENENATRTPSLTIALEAQAVTVRFQQTNASAKTELYALEVEARPFPLGAVGPVA